jgi:hypothetical protein
MLINIEIGRILDIVWKGAQPYFELFQALGLSILGLIIVIELIKSAWALSTGSGWHFSRTLLHMIVLGIVLSTYVVICKELWSFGIHQTFIAITYSGGTFGLGDVSKGSLEALEAIWLSFCSANNPFGGISSALNGILVSIFLLPLLGFILIVLNIIVYLIVFGHFMGFLVLLLSGFVFVPFLLSSDMRQIFIIWLNNLIVYLVTFLSFRLAITICAILNGYQKFIFTNEVVKNSELSYVYELLFVPLVQVIVMFKVPGMVRSIVGYGAGAGGGEFAASGSGLVGGLLLGASRVRMLSPRR